MNRATADPRDHTSGQRPLRRIALVLLFLLALTLTGSPGRASPNVWHGKKCVTYHSQELDQETCAIINRNDIYTNDLQALFNFPSPYGADRVTFDYVRLYRDGVNVAWHGDGTNWTIDICYGCQNFTSSDWTSICGTHTWYSQARFYIVYTNGAIGNWKVLSSNDWVHSDC